MPGLITLTTDFGLQDWFVGVMKGAILGIHPSAQIVDLTHEIPPGDIRAGAFVLASAFEYFPVGTVHVAVVDPGVGSERAAIAVQTKHFAFVGPDNGVLSLALARAQGPQAVHQLTEKKFFLKTVSNTFHGRDVFAPVAAHLSQGMAVTELGPELSGCRSLSLPHPSQEGTRWKGSILYVDRFGNALTDLSVRLSVFTTGQPLQVRVPGNRLAIPVREFYQSVGAGKPVAVIGSTGLLEIAINGGNAAKRLRLKAGVEVILEPAAQRRRAR